MESDGKLPGSEDAGQIRIWDQRKLSRVQASEEKRFQENMEHLNKEQREVVRCFEKDKQEWVKRYADHCAAMNLNCMASPSAGMESRVSSNENYSVRGRDLIRRNTLYSVSNPVTSGRVLPSSGTGNNYNNTATTSFEDVAKSVGSSDVTPQLSVSRKISISPLSSPSRTSILNCSQPEENEIFQSILMSGNSPDEGGSSPKNNLPTWKQQEVPIIRRLTPHKIKKEKRECAEIAAMFGGCPVKLDPKIDSNDPPQSQASAVVSTRSRIRRQQSTPNYMSSTKTSLLRFRNVS